MLAREYGVLREGADLHEAVFLKALLQRDGGFDAFCAHDVVDFDECTHGRDACLDAFGDELGAAEGEVGDVIAGFGLGGVGECFVECASGGGEVLVAVCVCGEEKGFVEVNMWVAEGGEEE